MDEIQKIKDKLRTSRQQLLAVVAGLEAASWEWQPSGGRWTVRLTLAHVALAQWSHLEVVRHLASGQLVQIPNFDLDTWNNAQVASRADWTVAQILDNLDSAQQESLGFLDELEPEQLAITGSHPALGEVTIGQVMRIMAVHDGLHRRDIVSLLREMVQEA